jgi:ribose/xylose/arabinose/galactoside ABC-type transport system permease subunit
VFGFPYDFIVALTGNIWFVPAPVVLALAIALILWFVTAKTRLGRNIVHWEETVKRPIFPGSTSNWIR